MRAPRLDVSGTLDLSGSLMTQPAVNPQSRLLEGGMEELLAVGNCVQDGRAVLQWTDTVCCPFRCNSGRAVWQVYSDVDVTKGLFMYAARVFCNQEIRIREILVAMPVDTPTVNFTLQPKR